jgi:hypothetical protein
MFYISRPEETVVDKIKSGNTLIHPSIRPHLNDSLENWKKTFGTGNKNLMINGDFQVWQRRGQGETFTPTSDSGYAADRWKFANGTVTYDSSLQAIKHVSTGNDPYFLYAIEDYGNEWTGKDFCFSFYIKCNDDQGMNELQYVTIGNVNYYHRQPMNDGDTKHLFEIPSDIPGFTRYFCTGNFNAAHTNYHRIVIELRPGLGNVTYLKDIQMEFGKFPSPFMRRSYGEELALCQRYLVSYESRSNFSSPTSFVNFGNGTFRTTAFAYMGIHLPVAMRHGVSPTIELGGAGLYTDGWFGGSTHNITSINFQGIIHNIVTLQCFATIPSGSIYRPTSFGVSPGQHLRIRAEII